MGYYDMVEDCWRLSDTARDYVEGVGREVSPEEMWTQVFVLSPLVDLDRTLREAPQLDRIFLKSPYGLQYRADLKYWVPFRHGAVDLSDESKI